MPAPVAARGQIQKCRKRTTAFSYHSSSREPLPTQLQFSTTYSCLTARKTMNTTETPTRTAPTMTNVVSCTLWMDSARSLVMHSHLHTNSTCLPAFLCSPRRGCHPLRARRTCSRSCRRPTAPPACPPTPRTARRPSAHPQGAPPEAPPRPGRTRAPAPAAAAAVARISPRPPPEGGVREVVRRLLQGCGTRPASRLTSARPSVSRAISKHSQSRGELVAG